MKYFHVIKKSYREPWTHVLVNGIVLGEDLCQNDIFNTVQRYARTKDLKLIWELRPNMLVESVETCLKVIDIEIGQRKLDSAAPKTGCRLILQGKDNIRNNDVLLIMPSKTPEIPAK